MLSDIFSFLFTLLLPNWLLISIRIYSGIARFPCDSMAFLLLYYLHFIYVTIGMHLSSICNRRTTNVRYDMIGNCLTNSLLQTLAYARNLFKIQCSIFRCVTIINEYSII